METQSLADFNFFTDSTMAISIAIVVVFVAGVIYISLPCTSKSTPLYRLTRYILTFIWNSIFCKVIPGLKVYNPENSMDSTEQNIAAKAILEDKTFIQDLQKVYKDDLAIKDLIRSKISNVVEGSIHIVRENYGNIAKKVAVYFNIKKEESTSVYFDFDEGLLFNKDSLGTIKIKTENDKDK